MRKIILLLLTILVWAGCSNQNQETAQEQSRKQESSQPIAMADAQRIFYLNDSTNRQLGEIQYDQVDDQWEIIYQDAYYEGRLKNDKRKFYDQSGETLAEIKFKDDGFKLRDAQGNLLWKVKRKDDKIKIARDEAMTNPFEIRIKNEYYAELSRSEEQMGTIELSPENNPGRIEGEGQFYYFTGPEPAISGILFLIQDMEPLHRLMVMTEMLARNP
ncbi:MAG: hypothetical protein ACNS62_04625 [Candidatus Cyclobacteriaceae bacterium M3_2C_046]